MARKELYCDKCKKTHYVRVCDLCGKEFDEYPDFEFAITRAGLIIDRFEICNGCKKELVKNCKKLKKATEKKRSETK